MNGMNAFMKKEFMEWQRMKRFVKCFFELLTQALSAAGNGAGKGG